MPLVFGLSALMVAVVDATYRLVTHSGPSSVAIALLVIVCTSFSNSIVSYTIGARDVLRRNVPSEAVPDVLGIPHDSEVRTVWEEGRP
jgi:hypothetical protein